ncbi:MAG: HEAT repeat domain-containing protein [Promethearchaeota archaeon]
MNSLESLIEHLDEIGKNEAIQRLHYLYSLTDNKETRIKILGLLNKFHDNTHFEETENYFVSDEDPEVRIEAAKLLAFNYDGKAALAPLLWVLKNEKKLEIRRVALRLLVPLARKKEHEETIIKVLKEALKNGDKKIQMDAAESLGILEEHSANEELMEVLNKVKDKNVRIKVIQALLSLKTKKAIPTLLDNLKLESLDEWKFAFNALLQLTSKEELNQLLIQKLENLKGEKEDRELNEKKQGIARALGQIGNKESIPFLLDLLKDYHDWVREETLLALDKIDSQWKKNYRIELKKRNIYL